MKYVKKNKNVLFVDATYLNFFVLPASILNQDCILSNWNSFGMNYYSSKSIQVFYLNAFVTLLCSSRNSSLKLQTCVCWTVTWCRKVRGRILARVSLNDVIAASGDIKWLQCGTTCHRGGCCCPLYRCSNWVIQEHQRHKITIDEVWID